MLTISTKHTFRWMKYDWTRERATRCTKCWSYLNSIVWVLYLSKILKVKNETFFVLSSLYAMYCDANASSWQTLKLTFKRAHRTSTSKWNVNINRERQILYNIHTAIPHHTMLCDTCIWIVCCAVVCEVERKWRTPCMKCEKQAHTAEKKTFTKRESWNSASMLTAKF